MKRQPFLTYQELLKPTTMTCGRCGGTLNVFPYEHILGYTKKGIKKVEIKTINICEKCSIQPQKIGE